MCNALQEFRWNEHCDHEEVSAKSVIVRSRIMKFEGLNGQLMQQVEDEHKNSALLAKMRVCGDAKEKNISIDSPKFPNDINKSVKFTC